MLEDFYGKLVLLTRRSKEQSQLRPDLTKMGNCDRDTLIYQSIDQRSPLERDFQSALFWLMIML
ncbi:hypothetical protein [uncultured Imperialibacter sp.]|uniref:hypothetical protein n=1 Tax=uncultured Imperialibacter sp. TaxID=1672639 RepID=UPI0030DC19B1